MAGKKTALAGVLLIVAILFGVIAGSLQAQEFGSNWSATFFPSNNLSGAGVPITGISAINFNWGTGAPIVNGIAVPGMGVDNFSARFTAAPTFNAGTYTFTVASDDGIRVIIDGTVALDRFIGRALTTDTFQYSFSTAGPHNITVEYFEGIDQAIVQVQWGFTGAATLGPTGVPGPTATAAPTSLPPIPAGAITAVVIRAPVLNIRAAPSVFSERLGAVLRGQTYQVVGRDENARWFLLQLSGYQGWALGYYLFIRENEFNAPVVSDFTLGGNPASISGVVAQSEGTLRLRAQPNIYSEQIGRITWGGVMAVTGRTRAGDWWQVVWKGTTGWAVSAWLEIVEGDINDVPIIP